MSKTETFAKVDKAMAEGEYWRAKEILQGNVHVRGYDIDVYCCLGEVLLKMGDKVEAGKYLFLSGVRKKEYEQTIELFLNRYSKNADQLLYVFPKSARVNLEAYPENVKELLVSRGYSKAWGQLRKARNQPVPRTKWQKVKDTIFGLLIIVLIVIFVIGLIEILSNGFRVIIKWLF